jgi:hypothetical protein
MRPNGRSRDVGRWACAEVAWASGSASIIRAWRTSPFCATLLSLPSSHVHTAEKLGAPQSTAHIRQERDAPSVERRGWTACCSDSISCSPRLFEITTERRLDARGSALPCGRRLRHKSIVLRSPLAPSTFAATPLQLTLRGRVSPIHPMPARPTC